MRLSGREKVGWFKTIYHFLKANDVDFAAGWKGMAEALERLADLQAQPNTNIRWRAIGAYRLCLGKSQLVTSPQDIQWARQQRQAVRHAKGAEARKIAEFYASYEWRVLRYRTLQRYGRKCMCCGRTDGMICVDHIKPLRRYWQLRLDPDNTQVLCEECNHGKGNWDETDYRPQARPRIRERPRIVPRSNRV